MIVGTHLSEECEVDVGVHQGLVLSQLLSSTIFDIVANEMKEGMQRKILHADDSLYSGEHGRTAGNILLLERCT